MKNLPRLSAEFLIIVLAVLFGMFLGRVRNPQTEVHAQDKVFGSSTCTATVSSSLGEFKGGSSYGLAFQDSQGVIRFILNPPCGGAIVNGYQQAANAYVALEIQRN
jgi:hypothetical protein